MHQIKQVNSKINIKKYKNYLTNMQRKGKKKVKKGKREEKRKKEKNKQ